MEDNKNSNQQIGVPLGIYQERYKALAPTEISLRTGVPYDNDLKQFSLTVLGFTLVASWPEFSLKPSDDACPTALYDGEAQILMIRYLIEGFHATPSGNFVPYRELPWGEVYDKNFQGRCIKRLAFAFGAKLDAFAKACASLSGVPYTKGDSSCDLPFLPALTVRLILWSGDDEFPPQSQWLFSDNTPLAFSAEDVAVIGDVICASLKELSKKAS